MYKNSNPETLKRMDRFCVTRWTVELRDKNWRCFVVGSKLIFHATKLIDLHVSCSLFMLSSCWFLRRPSLIAQSGQSSGYYNNSSSYKIANKKSQRNLGRAASPPSRRERTCLLRVLLAVQRPCTVDKPNHLKHTCKSLGKFICKNPAWSVQPFRHSTGVLLTHT